MEIDQHYLKIPENLGNKTKKSSIKVTWMIILITTIQLIFHLHFSKLYRQNIIFNPQKKYEYWRFLTYTLVHSSWNHLIVNLFSELIFAYFLEKEQGPWRILIMFMTGAISGCLVSLKFNPETYLQGSSAGAYSIIIGNISHICLNFQKVDLKYLRIICIVIFCGFDVGSIVLKLGKHHFGTTAAHFGGAANGLMMGFLIYKSENNRYLLRICVFVCFCILYILLIYCVNNVCDFSN